MEKKDICLNKLKKLSARIMAMEDFLSQTKNSGLTYGEWLRRKGVDPEQWIVPVGYLKSSVCSVDSENDFMPELYSNMVFVPEIGYPLVKGGALNESEHDEATSSMLGYTWNPQVNLYFPTTIYDCLYESIYTDKTQCAHLMGGFTQQDIMNITADEKMLVGQYYINSMEQEADNVADYFESIYSNASGDSRPAANVRCRTGCDIKHTRDKEKRTACKAECDKKFPPSQKQDDRREDRGDRQDARDAFRDEKKRCEDEFRAGRLSKADYKKCKREGREEKKRELENIGRSGFTKAVRGFNKVNPVTLAGRNAALVAISQLNLFGFATRMYPAFASGDELKKYKPEYVSAAKDAWIKIARAWKNLGGDPEKLKQAIINGRNKKAHKEPEYSNAVDPATAAAIISAASAVLGSLSAVLVQVLKNRGASKDPFISGNFAPPDFEKDLNSGEFDYSPDDNDPIIDEDGNWIDPKTGRKVDPKSGEYLIMGIRSSRFWIGVSVLAVVAVVGVVLATRKKK